jgi:hypothetical protein
MARAPDHLSHFASVQMRRPFAWGTDDCLTLPADWLAKVTGLDPMADLRGRYDSAATCQRLTGFFNNPDSVVSPRMAGFAAREGMAQRGDVGLVMTLLGNVPRFHGAIFLGKTKWLVRSIQQNIDLIEPAKVIRIWQPQLAAQSAAKRPAAA